jgi:phosphoglycolate phosphatase
MRPEAVLWDWDNTLVDAWGGVQAALNATFAAFGLPEWSRAEVLARVRGPLHESFPKLFGSGWRLAAETFRAQHSAMQLDHLVALPGVAAALDAFDGPMAVVSNKEGLPLRREVAHLGWAARFAVVVGADDAAAAKPDPAPIRHALARMGVKPGPTVWSIGDTGVDMLAARAAGVCAVMLGDAAHDGGAESLAQRGATPLLWFDTAAALASRLGRNKQQNQ